MEFRSLLRLDAIWHDEDLSRNVMAGATGWIAALATELSYGLIAFAPLLMSRGVHAWHGITAALLTAAFANAGIWGAKGRPAMTAGGRPMLSILLASYLGALLALPGFAEADSFVLLVLASLCVMLSGAFEALFGILKLGRIIKYVPHPVFSGFALAAALTLLVSAPKPLLGQLIAPSSASNSGGFFESVHVGGLAIGVATIVIGLNSRRWLPKVPTIVVSFIGGVSLDLLFRQWFGDALGPTLPRFDSIGIATPALSLFALGPQFTAAAIIEMGRLTLTTAFSLAMLASLETLVVNSALDHFLVSKVSGDDQLLSHGLGNMASGFVAGLPCAPSISRAMLVSRNGGRTYAVQATYIALTAVVIFFPQPLGLIPQSVLGAAMVLMAIGLIDEGMVRTLRQAFAGRSGLSATVRRQATENAVILLSVAVVGTLLGLLQAVVIGTVISTALFLQHNQREVVRRVVRCSAYRSRRVRSHSGGETLAQHGESIVVVEAQGPLYFATADRLFSEIESLSKECQWIILDCRRVTHVDTTGAHLLMQLVRHLGRQSVTFHLAHVALTSEIGETLRNHHLDRVLQLDHWHPDTDHALEACENALIEKYFPANGGNEGAVPLLETDLCSGIGDPAMEEVLRRIMRRRMVKAGHFLFHQGETGSSLFVVTRGDVTLEVRLGEEKTSASLRLATYTPGVVFGEMAFLEGGAQRTADARAESDVEVFELSREDFPELQSAAPHVANQLLVNVGLVLASRLRNRTKELADLEAV